MLQLAMQIVLLIGPSSTVIKLKQTGPAYSCLLGRIQSGVGQNLALTHKVSESIREGKEIVKRSVTRPLKALDPDTASLTASLSAESRQRIQWEKKARSLQQKKEDLQKKLISLEKKESLERALLEKVQSLEDRLSSFQEELARLQVSSLSLARRVLDEEDEEEVPSREVITKVEEALSKVEGLVNDSFTNGLAQGLALVKSHYPRVELGRVGDGYGAGTSREDAEQLLQSALPFAKKALEP
ncbi:hypothetical protein ACP4OV_018793 [Aristida adscensionis]